MSGTLTRPAASARGGLFAVLAVAAGLGLGLAVGYSPVLAAIGVLGVLAVIALGLWPVAVFGFALVFLAYAPENAPGLGPLSRPELPKAVMFAATGGLIALLGVRPRLLLPAVAYIACAGLAWAHGDVTAGLTPAQTASTFITLGIGWLVLAVRFDGKRDVWLLKVAALIPVICLLLGVLLLAGTGHPLFRAPTADDQFSRLQGASIAAVLGLGAFMSCAVSLICFRLTRWWPAIVIAVADAAIMFGTLSRGSALALLVALTLPGLRFVLEPLRMRPHLAALRAGLALLLIGIVAVTVVPQLQARGETGFTETGERRDSTSGREKAWDEFYAIAQESPLFGHGIGAGPITKIEQEGFLNQHNEYLRLFLEGGYVGGGLILACMIFSVGYAITRAPPRVRLDLIGMSLGLALVAATDNPFSSINVMVPFCLTLAICASFGREEPPAPLGGEPARA